MIKKKFTVPIYNWKIFVYICEQTSDSDELRKELKRNSEDVKQNDLMLKEIDDGSHSGGWTLTYEGMQKCVIVVYPHFHKCKLVETMFHEKRHVEDHIVKHHSVDDFESSAMLAGYLAKEFYPLIEKFKEPIASEK